jgi:hypothetical protein
MAVREPSPAQGINDVPNCACQIDDADLKTKWMHCMPPSPSTKRIVAEKRRRKAGRANFAGQRRLYYSQPSRGNPVLVAVVHQRLFRKTRSSAFLWQRPADDGLPHITESHSERAYPVVPTSENAHVTGHSYTPTAAPVRQSKVVERCAPTGK